LSGIGSSTTTKFIALVVIHVDGPATQRTLVDMLSRDVRAWVRHCPGFLSANYHVSVDGTQVVNYAEWSSEDAYRQSFELSPSKGAMRNAIRELPGVIDGPKMTGFTLDLRITADGPAPEADGTWAAADSLRKGTMQLGSRLRLVRPATMPPPDELNTLVALSNHGAAAAGQLAEWNQMPGETVSAILGRLVPAGLIEAVPGDQHFYQITAKGQLVLDDGRRVRNEWLAEGMTVLEFTPSERELLRQTAPLMERLARR
jgi:C-6 monooxygenase